VEKFTIVRGKFTRDDVVHQVTNQLLVDTVLPRELANLVAEYGAENRAPVTSEKSGNPDNLRRASFAACFVDDLIYIIGGYGTRKDPNEDRSVVTYCPRTGVWDNNSVSPVPGPLEGSKVAVVGTKIYSFGHVDRFYPDMYVLDTTTNEWSTITDPLPTIQGYSGCAVGKFLYVFGGAPFDLVPMPDGLTIQEERDYESVNTAFKYDIGEDEWFSLPDMPYKCGGSNLIVYNEKIYIVDDRRRFMVFDPSTDKYTVLASSELEGGVPFLLDDGYIYLMEEDNVNRVQRYDVGENSWREMSGTDLDAGSEGSFRRSFALVTVPAHV
jgi:hypothetical protein